MCPHARRGFFRSQNSAPRDSSAAKMATYEPAGWIYEPAGWLYEILSQLFFKINGRVVKY